MEDFDEKHSSEDLRVVEPKCRIKCGIRNHAHVSWEIVLSSALATDRGMNSIMNSFNAPVSTWLTTIPCLVAERSVLPVRGDKKSQTLPQVTTPVLIIQFNIIRNQLIL